MRWFCGVLICLCLPLLHAFGTDFADFELVSEFAGDHCLSSSSQTDLPTLEDCFEASIPCDGRTRWLSSFAEGFIRSFAFPELCLSTSDVSPLPYTKLGLVSCSDPNVNRWTYQNHRFEIRSDSPGTLPGTCIDVLDPFETRSTDAAWAWKHSTGLNLVTNNCSTSRTQIWKRQDFSEHSNTRVRFLNAQSTPVTILLKGNSGNISSGVMTTGTSVVVRIPNGYGYAVSLLDDSGVDTPVGNLDAWSIASFTIAAIREDGQQVGRILRDSIDCPVTTDNTAAVRIINAFPSRIQVDYNPIDCVHCAPRRSSVDAVSDYEDFYADFALDMTFTTDSNSSKIRHQFGHGGRYTVVVGEGFTHVLEDRASQNLWLPILVAAIVLTALPVFRTVIQKIRKKLGSRPSGSNSMQPLLPQSNSLHGSTSVDHNSKDSRRLHSLDTFRGMALTIMMFVNFGGGGYYFFQHSLWNGLTVADLVFPWFMWIMGTSLALSLQSFQSKQKTIPWMLGQIVKRSIKLFCLGCFTIGNIDWQHLRIFGVLQYFAFSYLIVATVAVLAPTFNLKLLSLYWPVTPSRPVISEPILEVSMARWWDLFVSRWPEWLIISIFPLIHLAVQFGLPVPGCPTGYLGPGGVFGDHGRYPYCTGGAHGFVDTVLVGATHVYQTPTARDMYGTGAYDPEGFLGMLNAVLMTFLGLQVGRMITTFTTPSRRIRHLLATGSFQCLIAALLSLFSQNGGPIPVNKNLWSLSFIFLMAGSGCLVLCLWYILVDVRNWVDGMPFRAVGMNSIFIYLMHEHFDGIPQPFGFHYETHAAQLTQHLWKVLFWCAIAVWLYRQKIFISV